MLRVQKKLFAHILCRRWFGESSMKIGRWEVSKPNLRPLTLTSWMKVPSPFGGRRWVGDRVDMGQKTVREKNWHGLWGNRISKNIKSTHSKMPILFRCSSNPDDRRPSGFKIHFIAAKLQPPAQDLQIKVKKVKSLEWMEGTLNTTPKTANAVQCNGYYVDTVQV